MDIVDFFLFLTLILGLISIERRIARADQRVRQVERKLDLMLDQFGLREEDTRMDKVAALVRDGKKIEAIKLYRDITGEGLKESKDAVERMA